ncbi:MAG: hypothetical protein FWE95_05315 [Planctomycetaceae bacterium]|nr:hypothetical protein [Planctomycetaceae bacterium]
MDELILQPDESLILDPGEGIRAGKRPLHIRVGCPNYIGCSHFGTNEFKRMEQRVWEASKHQSGNQTAMYRRGSESRRVNVVPENAKPESFDIEGGHSLAVTIRAFKIEKADMLGWLPQSGDTLEWDTKTYTVRKFGSGVFYQDVGNYEIVIRIFFTEYRG